MTIMEACPRCNQTARAWWYVRALWVAAGVDLEAGLRPKERA